MKDLNDFLSKCIEIHELVGRVKAELAYVKTPIPTRITKCRFLLLIYCHLNNIYKNKYINYNL